MAYIAESSADGDLMRFRVFDWVVYLIRYFVAIWALSN